MSGYICKIEPDLRLILGRSDDRMTLPSVYFSFIKSIISDVLCIMLL